METTCQDSYPLNSENESPFGTFTVYLSGAEIARPPTKANTPVIIGIVSIFLLFIASPPLSILAFLLLLTRYSPSLQDAAAPPCGARVEDDSREKKKRPAGARHSQEDDLQNTSPKRFRSSKAPARFRMTERHRIVVTERQSGQSRGDAGRRGQRHC